MAAVSPKYFPFCGQGCLHRASQATGDRRSYNWGPSSTEKAPRVVQRVKSQIPGHFCSILPGYGLHGLCCQGSTGHWAPAGKDTGAWADPG